MPIDPLLTSTVQVQDLPPAPISMTDNLVHEVGDILSRMTVAEFVAFIGSHSAVQQYEIKIIRAPDSAYVTANFDMSPGVTEGIGIVGGLWEGWAICNGNNGTDNLDGQTLIGFGAIHETVGEFLGSADAVVVEHGHVATPTANLAFGGGDGIVRQRAAIEPEGLGNPITVVVEPTGVSGVGKNMQPSMVVLIIMKL